MGQRQPRLTQQLLKNTIEVAEHFDKDRNLQQKKWQSILSRLPNYEVNEQGYLREWLWPGWKNNLRQRHSSQLFALYDDRPTEIVDNPWLVEGIEKFLEYHIKYKDRSGYMAFGLVQDGLAASRIGNARFTQETINLLAKRYWTTSLSSLHDQGKIMNMDISGGFRYLCSSALVYADPGYVILFPAILEQWKQGRIDGIRLRGRMLVEKLLWNEESIEVSFVSDVDQTIDLEIWEKHYNKKLKAGSLPDGF